MNILRVECSDTNYESDQKHNFHASSPFLGLATMSVPDILSLYRLLRFLFFSTTVGHSFFSLSLVTPSFAPFFSVTLMLRLASVVNWEAPSVCASFQQPFCDHLTIFVFPQQEWLTFFRRLYITFEPCLHMPVSVPEDRDWGL